MAEQFFTVEQDASLLQVHPITVSAALPQGNSQSAADAIWRDMTSGDDQKRDAAIAALIYAPGDVQNIVNQRSGEAAAVFYASPEGQAEWEDQADWRALDNEPFFDDEDESE